MQPVSRVSGFDRGTPVDRHYIERFLLDARSRGDFRGHLLEIGDERYARQIGGWPTSPALERVEVLDIDAGNATATIVGDLQDPDVLPTEAFDCIVCSQTLLLVYELRSAVANLRRALRPGGVLLATFPGISPVFRSPTGLWADHWRMTSSSAARLFGEYFPGDALTLRTYGNVMSATAFLYGVAAQELREAELEHHDPDYEVVICVRAVRDHAG
jgi:SAM-dependent methyltransferase